ncbi:unnamed protein product, partial [marine sediment metagenome]
DGFSNLLVLRGNYPGSYILCSEAQDLPNLQ